MTKEELEQQLQPLRGQFTGIEDVCEVLLSIIPKLAQENEDLRKRLDQMSLNLSTSINNQVRWDSQ